MGVGGGVNKPTFVYKMALQLDPRKQPWHKTIKHLTTINFKSFQRYKNVNFRDHQDQTDQGERAILWKLRTKQGLSGQKETKETFLFLIVFFFIHTRGCRPSVVRQQLSISESSPFNKKNKQLKFGCLQFWLKHNNTKDQKKKSYDIHS